MRVVMGLDGIEPSSRPAFVVVGVFDGLHRGHAYLLEHLVAEATRRSADPVVITFDHHPDEVLTGSAPPILCDPDERLDRLATAGVGTTVVVHFDRALRETPYEAFVDRIAARTRLDGFLMTPDAAFGYQRAGTPEALAALGAARGFEVVVVPAFEVDGRPVSSTQIRADIAAGNLEAAARRAGAAARRRGRGGGGGRGKRAPVPASRRPAPRSQMTARASERVHRTGQHRRPPRARSGSWAGASSCRGRSESVGRGWSSRARRDQGRPGL